MRCPRGRERPPPVKPQILQRLIDAVSQSLSRAPGDTQERERRRDQRREQRRARLLTGLCRALLSERGEVAGARLAREALSAWQEMDRESSATFFDVLADEFSPDPEAIAQCAEAYRESPTQTNLVRLQKAVLAPRLALFQRLNMAPGGTAQIVEMRRRVLAQVRAKPHWAGIESDLSRLLGSWFNRGFLVLQRIDWHTSAMVLEKLIEYEAVHEIQGWNDLRRRLAADRRCYAFFHPALPDEPVIFIEVALTRGMSASVQPLIDPASPVCDPAAADCAVFYSITNCQEGLRGISFGNLLIKQVAEDLGREFPRIRTFATLSPIPGFRAWLDKASREPTFAAQADVPGVIASLDTPSWSENAALRDALQPTLTRLCAHYLVTAKHGVEPLDSVARFHLGNGARLERLNWLADTSSAGMSRSAGLMVNYVYRLDDVERNHEAYANEHRVIASRRIESLARDAVGAPPKIEDKAQYADASTLPTATLPAVP